MNALRVLGFIAFSTLRNMLRRQLRRVREPRYLLATLFGLFYLSNLFFRPGFRSGRPRGLPIDDITLTLREDGLAWTWMLLVVGGWIFGGDEGGLTFSEAEIQILFPAPLSRRSLVHYKLVRSLLLAVFGAVVLTLGLGRSLGRSPVLFAAGAWLGIATLSLHLVAASLTRLRLLQEGLRGSARRTLSLAFPVAVLGSIAAGLLRVHASWPTRWPEVRPYLAQLSDTPPMSWAALPFVPAARVSVAASAADLWPWLPISLAVLALHYLWALSTGASFEQASIAAAERRAHRVEGMRRGHFSIRASARPPFKLSAHGAPAVAIFWKNLTAAVRVLSVRTALVVLLPSLSGGIAMVAAGGGFNRELGAVLCLVIAVSAALFGPQIYRVDFRLDLAAMDLLKSFPLRGVHLALAEVLAPFTVITLAEWIFLVAAATVAPASLGGAIGRVPLLLASMIVLPAFTLPGLIVQNAAALLFPAWVESGAAPPRGVEAIGQRLLTLVGTLIAVSLAMVPAAIVGGAVGALGYVVMGAGTAVVTGAFAGAVVVAAEAAVAFWGLGRAFERFDPGRV